MIPEILHEDPHILVVVKPAGLPSQKEPGELTCLDDLMRERLGGGFCGLVHRLDRAVHGLMVFAKTPEAAASLTAQAKARTMTKTYLAVVEGRLPRKEGRLEHYILKRRRKAVVFSRPEPGAKRAALSYKVLAELPDRSLVRIDLETGRYNQIRAQFAHIRHPVFGDGKYKRTPGKTASIPLVAYSLGFDHPATGERMTFTLPSLPPHWRLAWPHPIPRNDSV